MVHIGNQDTVMTQLPPPPKQFKPVESKTEEKKEGEEEKPEVLKDSYGRILKAPEKKEDTVPTDSYGRVIKEQEKKQDNKNEVKMIKGAVEKKRVGGIDDEENEQFVKHQSFENYLSEMKKRCKDKHLPHQKCQNCSAVQSFSYKVKYNCLDHKPYPLGMCNKCLPPAVVL